MKSYTKIPTLKQEAYFVCWPFQNTWNGILVNIKFMLIVTRITAQITCVYHFQDKTLLKITLENVFVKHYVPDYMLAPFT